MGPARRLQGVIFSLSNVVIQSSINSFGDTVMESAAAQNIEGFVYAGHERFHRAPRTFSGQNRLANAGVDKVAPTLFRLCDSDRILGVTWPFLRLSPWHLRTWGSRT